MIVENSEFRVIRAKKNKTNVWLTRVSNRNMLIELGFVVMKSTLKLSAVLTVMFAALTVVSSASAGVVSVVGARSELNTIATEFTAFGDTVVRYNQGWSSLSSTQLDNIFSSDIVWEGDIFSTISVAVQNRMSTFVNNNGGLLLTGERPCCEPHNDGVQAVARAVTGDSSILVGDLGFDLYDHVFSNSPTTILTAPNDIRGQTAQHSGPGRVTLSGGSANDACFTISKVSASATEEYCTAAAWGPDEMAAGQGRLIVYGDINSQPSLVNNFNGDQFENMREFLLAGFTGGQDVCLTNPSLPGCMQGVPGPAPVGILILGLGMLVATRRRSAQAK